MAKNVKYLSILKSEYVLLISIYKAVLNSISSGYTYNLEFKKNLFILSLVSVLIFYSDKDIEQEKTFFNGQIDIRELDNSINKLEKDFDLKVRYLYFRINFNFFFTAKFLTFLDKCRIYFICTAKFLTFSDNGGIWQDLFYLDFLGI